MKRISLKIKIMKVATVLSFLLTYITILSTSYVRTFNSEKLSSEVGRFWRVVKYMSYKTCEIIVPILVFVIIFGVIELLHYIIKTKDENN